MAEPGALAGKRIASNRDREFVFSKPVLERAGGFDAGLRPAGTAGASGSGSRDFANALFGPRSPAAVRGAPRAAVVSAAAPRAPQERFLLSSVNPALPTPTVSRTIAEMPVLPTDQRAGNEGKETLDLHIAFDAEDAAAGGVDPLFADAGVVSAPASIPTTRVAESPLRLAANDDGSGEEDEWEDVDDAADPERAPPLAAADAPIDLAGDDDDDDDAETAPGETRAAPGASRAEPKRGKFWSLNHGFLKGRSLGQWDEAEEAGGASASAAAAGRRRAGSCVARGGRDGRRSERESADGSRTAFRRRRERRGRYRRRARRRGRGLASRHRRQSRASPAGTWLGPGPRRRGGARRTSRGRRRERTFPRRSRTFRARTRTIQRRRTTKGTGTIRTTETETRKTRRARLRRGRLRRRAPGLLRARARARERRGDDTPDPAPPRLTESRAAWKTTTTTRSWLP